MKKSIFIAVLGAAGFAVSSYGQGIIAFDTYLGTYNGGSIAPITYFNGASAGSVVGSGFTATLYYALGTVTDPVDNASLGSIMAPISASFSALPSSATAVSSGIINGPIVQIADYTSGAISFEILVTGPNGFIGRSGAFTESTIAILGNPVTNFGNNGPGVGPTFVASPVPEPTTLALAGLGGLASLVAFRRKQA